MQEAIRKMQDRLFNKGRKYNELIQVRAASAALLRLGVLIRP